MKSAIEFYFSKGFRVFPVTINIEKENGQIKKKPIFPIKWQSEQINIERAFEFANTGKYNAIAILTGRESNLFVLDIDRKNGKDGHDFLRSSDITIPSDTPCVKTQSGGKHYYFKHPEELNGKSTSADSVNCIDLRGDNGLVFAPPVRDNSDLKYK